MLRWMLSHSFKDDINPIYGVYQEGEDIVMEAVNWNMEFEQQAPSAPASRERNESQNSGCQNWEETYDKMYIAWEPGERVRRKDKNK